MTKRNSKTTAAQGTSGIAQIGDRAWKFEMFSKRDDGPATHEIIRGVADQASARAACSPPGGYVIATGYRVVLTTRGWEREEHAAMPAMKVG